MNLSTIFIVAVIVAFLLALFHVSLGDIDLVVLGFVFFAAGHLSFPAIGTKA